MLHSLMFSMKQFVKSIYDIAITNAYSIIATYAVPTWSEYIAYKWIDGFLYRRFGSSDIQSTTISIWDQISYSHDWAYIIYLSNDWYIYRKNSNDTWNWTIITTTPVSAVWWLCYSPDWLYIIYMRNDYIYKKNSNDTLDWVSISSTAINNMTQLYWIGSYIYYKDNAWSWGIYKKDANDSLNWNSRWYWLNVIVFSRIR